MHALPFEERMDRYRGPREVVLLDWGKKYTSGWVVQQECRFILIACRSPNCVLKSVFGRR